VERERGLAPGGEQTLLGDLKERSRAAQIRAALGGNHEPVTLYGQIGRAIQQRQEEDGWGTQGINRRSADLTARLPRP